MTDAETLNWICAVLAIIGGLAAVFRPMAQQIEALLQGEERHRETEKEVAETKVRLIGIETQFSNLDERTLRMERAFDDKLRAMDEKIQMEYKAAESRLQGLSEVATKGIDEVRGELKALRDEAHENALAISAGNKTEGGA